MRAAFVLVLVATLLAGCGGAESGSVPQALALATRGLAQQGSWMVKGSSGGPLLYVSLPYDRTVNIYTIPGARIGNDHFVAGCLRQTAYPPGARSSFQYNAARSPAGKMLAQCLSRRGCSSGFHPGKARQ